MSASLSRRRRAQATRRRLWRSSRWVRFLGEGSSEEERQEDAQSLDVQHAKPDGMLAIREMFKEEITPIVDELAETKRKLFETQGKLLKVKEEGKEALDSRLDALYREVDGLRTKQSAREAGGEVLAKKALEVASKVGGSNAAGASTAAMVQARQLPVDCELGDHIGHYSTVRALKMVIDKKWPRFVESARLSSSQSLAKDFDGVSGLFKQDEPCSVLIRLMDDDNTLAGTKNTDWVAITYVPSGLKKREEMTWNGAGDIFITNFPEMRIKEMRINSLEDISYFAFMEVAKEVLSSTTNALRAGQWSLKVYSFRRASGRSSRNDSQG